MKLPSSILLGIIGCVLCVWPYGGALASTKYERIEDRLGNEPLTMWAFGLYRIAQEFSDWTSRKWHSKKIVAYGVTYIPKTRRISIRLTFPNNEKYSRTKCHKLMEDIRLNAGVFPDGRTSLGYSNYASFFDSDKNTARGYEGKDYLKEVDRLIYIDITFASQGTCEGPLVSKEVFYRD